MANKLHHVNSCSSIHSSIHPHVHPSIDISIHPSISMYTVYAPRKKEGSNFGWLLPSSPPARANRLAHLPLPKLPWRSVNLPNKAIPSGQIRIFVPICGIPLHVFPDSYGIFFPLTVYSIKYVDLNECTLTRLILEVSRGCNQIHRLFIPTSSSSIFIVDKRSHVEASAHECSLHGRSLADINNGPALNKTSSDCDKFYPVRKNQ